MKKTFVVDTNVILHSHQALFSFQEHDVVVPLGVIEELDRFKGFNDERGREARQASRELDRLRERGTLARGVPLDSGGTLQIMIDSEIEIPHGFGLDSHKVDNRILACALSLKKDGRNVVLISKDINCRIKADALGINTEDFETNKVDIDELYTGWRELVMPVSRIETFLREAEKNGHTCEVVHIYDLNYNGCRACGACRRKEVPFCIQDDDVTPLMEKVASTDCLVVASPIYMGQITGPLKVVLDRFLTFINHDFSVRYLPKKKFVTFITSGATTETYAHVGDYIKRWLGEFSHMEHVGTVICGGMRQEQLPEQAIADAVKIARAL